MECEHEYKTDRLDMANEGYMIMKFCVFCGDASGSGFLNKDHEIGYLEKLFDTPPNLLN